MATEGYYSADLDCKGTLDLYRVSYVLHSFFVSHYYPDSGNKIIFKSFPKLETAQARLQVQDGLCIFSTECVSYAD